MSYLKKAFTLIELLIVVAIIAILAAIAIPNFLQAQTRAKVSRAQSDIRTIAVGVESYHVDYNEYPWPKIKEEEHHHDHHGNHDDHHHHHEEWDGYVPDSLTTPVAYLSSLPEDPFAPPAYRYHYLTQRYQASLGHPELMRETTSVILGRPLGEVQYLMFSHGPDLDHPHHVEDAVQYDPTNGTVSEGSLWYFGPGVGFEM